MSFTKDFRHAVSGRDRGVPARALRAGLAALVLAAGLLTAAVCSTAVPAAPQNCLPVVPTGCVTTAVGPATATLPATSATTNITPPSVPAPAASTPRAASSGTGSGNAAQSGAQSEASPQLSPNEALIAHASPRIRGHGASRVLEIALRLSQDADVGVLLRRGPTVLARRHVTELAGANVLRVRLGARPKAGAARLDLTYTAASGEIARARYRIRIPR